LAAHQGEEFVIALPAVMLAGAWLLMKWAAKDKPEDDETDADGQAAEPAIEPSYVGLRGVDRDN
jgi:hypothetical protein